MERPSIIDFQANGKVLFTVNSERKFVRNVSDEFSLGTNSITIAALEIEVYDLIEVYVAGVLTDSYDVVNSLDPEAYQTKLALVFTVFTTNMSTAPINVTVDAPVTIDAPVATLEGYAILNVTDAAVVDLADGVDTGGAPVPIPVDATGARLVVQFTSVDAKMLFAANGMVPDNSPLVGEYVVENKTEIFLGKLPDYNGPPSELQEFRAIMITAKTATIYITYYKIA